MKRFGAELELALGVARSLCDRQLKSFQRNYRVLRKEAREFVTSIDLECHELAQELLSPAAPVLSEETRVHSVDGGELYWIVDPLDGSHNYIAGLPNFGVSIALVEAGRFVLAVIGIPLYGELFHAVERQGAFLNDMPIRVSTNAVLSKSMVAYDNQFHLSAGSFKRYRRLVDATFTTRILGSAAYDLSLVSRGRIDARIFNRTKVYDVAAGMVLVREAGGRVTDFAGADADATTTSIVASNGQTHDELLSVLEGLIDDEAGPLYGGIGFTRDPGGHSRPEPAQGDLGTARLCR